MWKCKTQDARGRDPTGWPRWVWEAHALGRDGHRKWKQIVKTANGKHILRSGIRVSWESWHLPWRATTGWQASVPCTPSSLVGEGSTPIVSATFHFNLNPFPLCEPLALSPLAHADLMSCLLEPAGLSHHRLGPLLTAEHSFLCHQSCPQHCFLLFLLPGMETASRVLVSWGRRRLQELSRYYIHWSEGRAWRAESSRDPNSSPREAHKNET